MLTFFHLYLFQSLSTPLQFQPGDELRVNCVYQSTDVNYTTSAGPFPSNELCYGFVGFYPAIDSFTTCGQWQDVEVCSNDGIRCDTTTFNILSNRLSQVCVEDPCPISCQVLLEGIRDTGCLTGSIGQYISTFPGVNSINYLARRCNITTTSSSYINALTSLPVADSSIFNCPSTQKAGKNSSLKSVV